MTKQEAAIVEAYTGITMLIGKDTSIFYEYIAKLMGRPVYTHEIPGLADELKERSKPDFINLCQNLTE